MPVWRTLTHNGVAFPDPYLPRGLSIRALGQEVKLSPLAEEMAYQFAKKKATPYVQDPVFVANFMKYFVKQLPPTVSKQAKFQDFDFSQLFRVVDEEKRDKETMTKEAKKSLAASRKEKREALRAKHGNALLDGKEIELANYMVEPPGLFMGRGCIAEDTIVMTTVGPKYVKELSVGDDIATHHGSEYMFYKTVSSVAKQGIREVYQLRTRTHSIRATENHPFLALRLDRSGRRNESGRFTKTKSLATLSWVTLRDLKRGDHVVISKRYKTPGTSKFSNAPKRTFGGAIVTPKFARILGYYLGDGFTGKRSTGANTRLSFAEGHPHLLERYARICEDVFGIAPSARKHSGGNSQVLSVHSREFADVFGLTGITGTALKKRVPGWIFALADDLKRAFLRGYLDADGNYFVNVIRGTEYASFGFESPNCRLIEDLRELAISAALQVSNISTREKRGYTVSQTYRFFISEYSSVTRLLEPGEALKGQRTRHYSLDSRANDLRTKWDWSHLHILDSTVFGLERVLDIEPVGKMMTYDVSMADSKDPNFIANQFVVHNSHPLRGSWKPRVAPSDVTLNLGEDAPKPPGDWGSIVHDHESIWIARWIDKLTEKEKYVWPHESSDIQQSRNKEKYDKALRIGERLPKLQAAIRKKMDDRDDKTRKIATVCCLIDEVGMRVGDEKDEDEADTVGATTLRVEHIKRIDDQAIEFDFLGKDSVRWVKTMQAPDPALVRNMRKFMAGKRPDKEIFDGIGSSNVNTFLSSIIDGLSAKVFRTYHATKTVEESLGAKDVTKADDIEKLHVAKLANLDAAIYCNHKRTIPKTWEASLEKKRQKLAEYKAAGKEERVKKMQMDIDLTERTKEYNLNTSMKNYIDPRTYKAWCDHVGLDWSKLYSKSLQRKFSWVAQSKKAWPAEKPASAAPVQNGSPEPTPR